ncbi:MAG: hypothetical protein IT198_14085 [Acidimicrobiia bacterium]|nr:hypothetical protein [Acidimicrobiia bacterium]
MRRSALRRDEGELIIFVAIVVLAGIVLGSIAFNLWHVHDSRKALNRIADTAANDCAAGGIDEGRYDVTGEVVLDIPEAERVAAESLRRQGIDVDARIHVTQTECDVIVTRQVDTLLARARPITITVRGTADPRRSN